MAREAPARTCRCGHDRRHPLVEATPDYGFWGWFALMGGISAVPKKLTWKCSRCGETVAVSRDREERRAFR